MRCKSEGVVTLNQRLSPKSCGRAALKGGENVKRFSPRGRLLLRLKISASWAFFQDTLLRKSIYVKKIEVIESQSGERFFSEGQIFKLNI